MPFVLPCLTPPRVLASKEERPHTCNSHPTSTLQSHQSICVAPLRSAVCSKCRRRVSTSWQGIRLPARLGLCCLIVQYFLMSRAMNKNQTTLNPAQERSSVSEALKILLPLISCLQSPACLSVCLSTLGSQGSCYIGG
jgi:hypothetical protein